VIGIDDDANSAKKNKFGFNWEAVTPNDWATIAAVQGVPAAESGLASGVLNTSRLVGGALGLAVLTTLATSRTDSRLADGVGALQAHTDGYQLAFGVGAMLCLLGAIAAAALMGRRAEAPAPAFADEQAA